MNRRQFLAQGIAVGGLCCNLHAQPLSRPKIYGCVLPVPQAGSFLDHSSNSRIFATGQEEIISKSGDPLFDTALAQTLAHIATVFEVLPGFAYYEDDESKNAYATEAARLRNADGTVLFGTNLLKSILSTKESPDAAVTAVCAHEFGHILQMKHRLDKQFTADSTVKRAELQADFFAGYYAGLRKRSRKNYPAAVFALTQFNMGDDRTTFEGHHGKPYERGQAVSAGFESSYNQNLSLSEAIEASKRFVTGIK
jgi:hypothetical protein